jgi:hypothetical protein
MNSAEVPDGGGWPGVLKPLSKTAAGLSGPTEEDQAAALQPVSKAAGGTSIHGAP